LLNLKTLWCIGNQTTVMQNYSQQQQAVILKGIAQQILSMNVPTFQQAEKLFIEFGIDFEGNELYSQMFAALEVALTLSEENQEFIKKEFNLKWTSDIVHRIAHYAMKMDKPDVNQLRTKVLTDK
jgi:hypothetical protein